MEALFSNLKELSFLVASKSFKCDNVWLSKTDNIRWLLCTLKHEGKSVLKLGSEFFVSLPINDPNLKEIN